MQQNHYKIGLVINPISGMGGAVGLKGTDGEDILERAIELGASPQIQERAEIFLNTLKATDLKIEVITPPGIMGENACIVTNTPYQCISPDFFDHALELYSTTKTDTYIALERFIQRNVSLIIFFGGDGTARDVLHVVDQKIPCLGIPGGVKVYSSVFAADPVKGAELLTLFLKGEATLTEAEVVDIDEIAFREDQLQIKIYGHTQTPSAPMLIQGNKQTSPFTDDERANQIAIARTIIEGMDQEKYYILGPGTTVRAVGELLNFKKTLLGFDIVRNKAVLARDVNEKQILEIIGDFDTSLVISPIGRQGFVFGRGNLQITTKVMQRIRKEDIHIICTRSKIQSLPNGCIRTDIRDPSMDENLKGFYRVLVDYNEYQMVKMV